jgi:hypothetical protein
MHIHLYGAKSPNRETQMLPGWNMGGENWGRTHAIPKPTPYAMRQFSESPVPRRAINAIKGPVASLSWKIQSLEGADDLGNQEARIKALTYSLNHPNHDDSWRSLVEQVIEDTLVGSYGSIELGSASNPLRPLWMWPVDGSTIRVYPGWDGSKDQARYAQVTGFTGRVINIRNDDLIYMKMNPRTNTPFGLGAMEVAFDTINQFLTANAYAGKAASNMTPPGILSLGEAQDPGKSQAFRNYWRNEVEGRAIMPIIAGEKDPKFIPLFRGDDSDMRLGWQSFLIRVIGASFSLSSVAMGLEQDVNRNTADVMREFDQDNAIKPMALLLSEYINREAIHRKLGWTDLELVYTDLDQADDERLARIHKMELDADIRTPDEVRAERGLPPLPGNWGNITMTQRKVIIMQARGSDAENANPATQTLREAFELPDAGEKRPHQNDE